jgi:hypothetical protein
LLCGLPTDGVVGGDGLYNNIEDVAQDGLIKGECLGAFCTSCFSSGVVAFSLLSSIWLAIVWPIVCKKSVNVFPGTEGDEYVGCGIGSTSNPAEDPAPFSLFGEHCDARRFDSLAFSSETTMRDCATALPNVCINSVNDGAGTSGAGSLCRCKTAASCDSSACATESTTFSTAWLTWAACNAKLKAAANA